MPEAETKINLLRDRLAVIAPRPVPYEDQSNKVLCIDGCWAYLTASDDGGMKASDLLGRVEKLYWQPTIVKFQNQRRGDA